MRCPHCGNTDRSTIESNGFTGPDLVLLCLARVPVEDSSIDHCPAWEVPGYDRETKTAHCGMQWSPEED